MSDFVWLNDAQMARPRPFSLKSHGKQLVDHPRVLCRIIFINRNGFGWRDAPIEYAHRRRSQIAGSFGVTKVSSLR